MKATTAKDTIKTIKTHYIDGAFVESHGEEIMDIVRPTDGQVIGRVTLGDEEDTRRAVGAARRAFATFGRTTREERANALRRLHQAVSARIDDLTAAMVEEYGGVVQFAKPQGVCNVVIGRGDVVGAELVRNPDVDKISFTGSVAVGERIMRDGAETLKRVTLELGGKSPTILLDDAVLREAIPSALVMAFLNSGQACAAGTRLLVPKSRLDEIKQSIRDAMRAFTVGDPADPKTVIGPMVSQKQYDRVESYIRKGIEEGAEVLVGGEGHPENCQLGYFVKPTVFVNVKNDMTIAQEEIFGPVLCVIAYDSEDDAIHIAIDSKYGLHAAVLGADLQRARRVAAQIRSGRVVINGMTDDPQAPWGGFKYSGVGREYGRYGIEAFVETRAILES
jgi:aldehyde dehydrogenase (NAD+)